MNNEVSPTPDATPDTDRTQELLERVQIQVNKYCNDNVKYLDYLFNNVVDKVFEVHFWDVKTDEVVTVAIRKVDTGYAFYLGDREKYMSFVTSRGLESSDPRDVGVYQVGLEPFHPEKHINYVKDYIGFPDLGRLSEEDAYDHIGQGGSIYLRKGDNYAYYEADEVSVKALYDATEAYAKDPEDATHRFILNHLVNNLNKYAVWVEDGDRTLEMRPSSTGVGHFFKLTDDLVYFSMDATYASVDVYTNTIHVDASDRNVHVSVMNPHKTSYNSSIKRLSTHLLPVKSFVVGE